MKFQHSARPLAPVIDTTIPRRVRDALAAFALLIAVAVPALAGPGHDHGPEASTTTGTALPRFTAVSELFELVGILNGKTLTVYLDHAATNAPVKDAKLELELGGKPVVLEPHGEGEFIATLADGLQTGTVPVTATVIAGKDTDLLAGELDLHETEHATQPSVSHDWKTWLPWGSGGFLVLMIIVLALKQMRRRTPMVPTGDRA